MTRREKILGVATAIYALLLLITIGVTVMDFTQRNFAMLFIMITVWPVGRFFLLRHPAISAWLNRDEH